MATIDWPTNLAVILGNDYTLDRGDAYQRTPFEDGYIEQKKRGTHAASLRTFQVIVLDRNLVAFRAWEAQHAGAWFNYTDPEDGVTRDCRVIGGKVQLRKARDFVALEGVTMGYERYWRGQAALEGY